MRLVLAAPLYPPEIGGPAPYAKELSERLQSRGHQVMVLPFGKVRHLPPLIRHFRYFWLVREVAQGSDGVVLFDTWSTGVPALLAARSVGAKTIVRVGGDIVWERYIERTHTPVRLSEFYRVPRILSLSEWSMKIGTRYVMANADRVLFTTAWLRDLWANPYPRSGAIEVVPNACSGVREVSPATSTVFVAGGRDTVLKNISTLRRAFAQVQKQYPTCTLDTRALPPEEHEARLKTAYAVIIPSVSEVSPNTAIDAIRFGKPVIVTEDTGLRELLQDVPTYVDTRSEAALATAIENLLDPQFYATKQYECAHVALPYSWDVWVDTVERMLRD